MRLERRWHPQRLVTPHEVIVHEVQGDRVTHIFQLLAEPIRQPREPAHRHSHRQILTLDVARRNLRFVRLATDDIFCGPAAFAGAVARLRRLVVAQLAEVLDKHGVIDLSAEPRRHRFQVHPVAIGRNLNAMGHRS